MEMHQIRYFLGVCDHGGFSRAAQAFDITQPALTTAIRKLEEELGGALFHREGKRLVLSRLGETIRPHLEQILAGCQLAKTSARDFHLLKNVPLRIGLMPSLGPAKLARTLQVYRQIQPGVEIEIHGAPVSSLIHSLESGALDAVLMSAPDGLPDTLRGERLFGERYMVICPRGHRFESQDVVRLADMNGESYVDRLACEMREKVASLCREGDVNLYAAVRSDREDWIGDLVAAGLGVAFLPEYSVTHADIVARPLVDPDVSREILLVDVRGRQRNPMMIRLMDALKRSHP